jgi:hypothetical protein
MVEKELGKEINVLSGGGDPCKDGSTEGTGS